MNYVAPLNGLKAWGPDGSPERHAMRLVYMHAGFQAGNNKHAIQTFPRAIAILFRNEQRTTPSLPISRACAPRPVIDAISVVTEFMIQSQEGKALHSTSACNRRHQRGGRVHDSESGRESSTLHLGL
jgi:hypothetical protein